MLFRKIFLGVLFSLTLSPAPLFAQVKALILEELIEGLKPILRNQDELRGYPKSDFENILNFIISDVETQLLGRQDVAESLLNSVGRQSGNINLYSRYRSISDLIRHFENYKKHPGSSATLKNYILEKICYDANNSAIPRFLDLKNHGSAVQRMLQAQDATELKNLLNNPKNSSYKEEFDRLVKKLERKYLDDFKLSLMEVYKTSVAEVLRNFAYIVDLRKATHSADTFVWDFFEEDAEFLKYKGEARVKDYVDEELYYLVSKAKSQNENMMLLSLENIAQKYAEPIPPLQILKKPYMKYRPRISSEDEVLDFLKRLTKFLR